MTKPMAAGDVMAAVAVTALWGFNFVVAKVGLTQFPPLMLVAARFFLVAAILAPFVPIPRAHLKEIMQLSLTLGVLHFTLMFTALRYVDAAVAGICIQTQVPFSALLAAILFKDKLGWRRALGMVVAFAGVAVLAGEPRTGSPLWGVAMVVAAALVWAIANIQIKRMGNVDGFALNAWLALFSAPQLALLSLLVEEGQIEALTAADWRGFGAIAYQAIIVVIVCYGLWFRLLRQYTVNQVVPWTLLVPLYAVLFGVLILDEQATWNLLVGGAMTVLGVAVILMRRPRLTAEDRRVT